MNEKALSVVLSEMSAAVQALQTHGVPARDQPDLAQEVRVEAWRAIVAGKLDASNPRAVRGWLYQVARFAASHYHRAAARAEETRAALAAGTPDHVAAAEQVVLARSDEAELAAALVELAKMSPDQHAVLVRYDLDEYAMSDIAAALSIPVNTAWNRLRLARQFLRASVVRDRRRPFRRRR